MLSMQMTTNLGRHVFPGSKLLENFLNSAAACTESDGPNPRHTNCRANPRVVNRAGDEL